MTFHDDELDVDATLVSKLLATQLPTYADLCDTMPERCADRVVMARAALAG